MVRRVAVAFLVAFVIGRVVGTDWVAVGFGWWVALLSVLPLVAVVVAAVVVDVRAVTPPEREARLWVGGGVAVGSACAFALGRLAGSGRVDLLVALPPAVAVVAAALVAGYVADTRMTLKAVLKQVGAAVMVATAVAYLAILLQQMYSGGAEQKTLAVSVIAVALSVVVGLADKWFAFLQRLLVGRGAWTWRQPALLAVCCLLTVPSGLLRASWFPGMVNNCYTPPSTAGMSVLRLDADGTCFGLLDTASPGLFATDALGLSDAGRALQKQLFDANQPLEGGDLTVIWMGSLSCLLANDATTRCADPARDYPAERDQLRGLLLAQKYIDSLAGHRHVHVVIADVAQDVQHADDVAQLIVDRKGAFGARVVVIGGGDSREVTQKAINRLLDNRIPFIAQNLLADLGDPGKSFMQRPGYFQLPYPNQAYAIDTIRRLRQSYPNGFRLDIYQTKHPDDLYTTSLVNDMFYALDGPATTTPGSLGGRFTARHVSDLAQLDRSSCADDGTDPPAVLFFADRWTRFPDFLERVNEVCGASRPRMVMADGSVSRFMANSSLRARSNAVWPLDYYVGGRGCQGLSPDHKTLISKLVNSLLPPSDWSKRSDWFTCGIGGAGAEPYCTIEAAASSVQKCAPNDLGNFITPIWDAVMLADALPADFDHLTVDNARLRTAPFLNGVPTVRDGHLASFTIPVAIGHVDRVADPTSQPIFSEAAS